jgi:hypothetical protein
MGLSRHKVFIESSNKKPSQAAGLVLGYRVLRRLDVGLPLLKQGNPHAPLSELGYGIVGTLE